MPRKPVIEGGKRDEIVRAAQFPVGTKRSVMVGKVMQSVSVDNGPLGNIQFEK